MPYDSNGNFSLVPSYFVQDGDDVLPSQHNPPMEDISSGLSQVILRNGVAPLTGNLNANGNKVINLAAPTNPNDAARLADISNKPSFRAAKSTNQNGSGTQIFALEEFDVGSGYDPTTGEFTAPEDGVYQFTSFIRHVLGDSGKTPFVMYIRKNSTIEVESASNGLPLELAGLINTTSISCLLQLAKDDVVDITTDGSFTTRGDAGGTLSWFQGFKL